MSKSASMTIQTHPQYNTQHSTLNIHWGMLILSSLGAVVLSTISYQLGKAHGGQQNDSSITSSTTTRKFTSLLFGRIKSQTTNHHHDNDHDANSNFGTGVGDGKHISNPKVIVSSEMNSKKVEGYNHDDSCTSNTDTHENDVSPSSSSPKSNNLYTIPSTSSNTVINTRQNPPPSSLSSSSSLSLSPIPFKPIGYISSIYRLCVGTPRQGLLAPNSRGQIILSNHTISSDSIQDLQQFSHLWIVFVFHLNNNTNTHVNTNNNNNNTMETNDDSCENLNDPINQINDNTNNNSKKKKKKKKQRQFPSKIAPPALGGKKVGIFATRTPHRPNPIGFTLCQIDSISRNNNNNHTYCINISGIDLVDGTPVLDIKPYVPHYDSVIESELLSSSLSTLEEKNTKVNQNTIPNPKVTSNTTAIPTTTTPTILNQQPTQKQVQLPTWIQDGLSKRRTVQFTPKAIQQLHTIMMTPTQASHLQFYGVHTGRDSCPHDALVQIQSCIEQVLSVDVRSAFQTLKVRKGKYKAERTDRVREIMNQLGEGGGGENHDRNIGKKNKMQFKNMANLEEDDNKYTIHTKEQISNPIIEEENTLKTPSNTDIPSAYTNVDSIDTSESNNDDNTNNNHHQNNHIDEVKICTQQLDNLLIQFIVQAVIPHTTDTSKTHHTLMQTQSMDVNDSKEVISSVNTNGSGADDVVVIQGIELIPT